MKNSMKKLLCMILAMVMVACMVACGESESEKKDDSIAESAVEETTTETVPEEQISETVEPEKEAEDDEKTEIGVKNPVEPVERPLVKEETTSSGDEAKVAAAVEAMQSGFMEGFKSTVGDAAEATMTADGTKIVFRLKYTSITADQVKVLGEDKVEETCDSMIENTNLLGIIRNLEPAVSALVFEVYGSDDKEIFVKEYE